MNEQLEIRGDEIEDVRNSLEEEMVDAHYRDWLARQPKEITRTIAGNPFRGWYYVIYWRNNRGEHFTEYPETRAEYDARYNELSEMRDFTGNNPSMVL